MVMAKLVVINDGDIGDGNEDNVGDECDDGTDEAMTI